MKTLISPWITRGLIKSSKRKQKFYTTFFKNTSYRNEQRYNVTKTWEVIKEVIGKTKLYNDSLPKKLTINNQEIYSKNAIAESSNDFFINVGPNLAERIPETGKHFRTYLKNVDNIMPSQNFSDEEFEEAFFSQKTNKSGWHSKQ